MSDTTLHWILAVVALAGFIATVLVQLRAASRMEGSATQRLDGIDNSIEKIEDEQIRQWNKIGEHGETISALKTKVGLH